MEKYFDEINKVQKSEERKRKEQQNSMILMIVIMIIAISFFAAIAPSWSNDGTIDTNKVQIQWAFIGLITAFMIFLFFSRGASIQKRDTVDQQGPQKTHTTSDKKAYRPCPKCGRAITFEVNVCPYCEKHIHK